MKRLLLSVCLILLVACGNGLSPIRRTGDPTPVPVNTPAAGAALVGQAVALVLDRYVDPLDSAALFGAAYDGAAKTLQASGKAPQAQRPAFNGDRKGDALLFERGYLALAEGAGPDVTQTDLAYETIRSVAEQVDECHTSFLNPDQYKQVTAGLEGKENYGGIGVSIRTQTRPVVIGEVFPDTPAERSGLRPGDAILAVNGTDVTDLPADQISPLVRGAEGTQVTLTIRRPGEGEPRDIMVTRARITLPVFRFEPPRDGPDGTKIGYMRLYSFSTGVEKQVQQALEEFDRQGVTGWVLDLRDNGGGYVNTLSEIAGRVIEGGQVVAFETVRGGKEEPIESDRKLHFERQRPLAVLINGGSASSSEALAAAVQDYERGRLLGQKSAGCLAAAQMFPLSDGSAMNITVAKVVSPKKHEINRVGVQPDETVAPDPTGNSDPVLDAAIRWLATQR